MQLDAFLTLLATFGRFLDAFWTLFRRFLDAFWTLFGHFLGAFWTLFGHVLDAFERFLTFFRHFLTLLT